MSEAMLHASLEELRNIVRHAPLWPGDTISHRTAAICCEHGWIVRVDGRWVPTALGRLVAANDVVADA